MKPHILMSENPLCEKQDYKTPCKSRVVKAHFLRSLEPGQDLRMIDLRGACWECLKAISLADFLRGRYLAFAVDGELLRHQD